MGLTVAKADLKDQTTQRDDIKLRVRKVTFDSSYPTGGEAITASDFGLTRLIACVPLGPAIKSDVTDAVAVAWNPATGKLATYRQKDPADAGGADIALPEVADTTNLASYSVHVLAIGI